MLKQDIEVGQVMSTYGGWDAVVVWICQAREHKDCGFYAVHKPYMEEESGPIWHNNDGKGKAVFAVNEPPVYGLAEPADIIMPPEMPPTTVCKHTEEDLEAQRRAGANV